MRRKYSKELKNMITQEICVKGKSAAKVSLAYDVPVKTVENWVTAFHKNPDIYRGDVISAEEKLSRMEKEVDRLRTENDILKKTISFIAKKV